jgi:hypothetical protein
MRVRTPLGTSRFVVLADRRADSPGGVVLPTSASPSSAGNRTSGVLRFAVDLPANHLGPGWRRRA